MGYIYDSSYWFWISHHGGRSDIYFTFSFGIWRIVLLYSLCDGVSVKGVILSIAFEWNIWSPTKCLEIFSVSTPLWQIRAYLLAYTCMTIIYAKIYVHMIVPSIWVPLILLVVFGGVSRSYWVTGLQLLIVLIERVLLWIIPWLHVLTVWTPFPIKKRTSFHVECAVRW